MERPMWINWVGDQVLLLTLSTERLVLHVHLIACEIEQAHPYLTNVHRQFAFLQLSRVKVHLRGIVRPKGYFVIVLSKLNRIVRNRRDLPISANHSVFLVRTLVARRTSQVQGLWLLGLLVSHNRLVLNDLTWVFRLVYVARGQVQVNLWVTCLGNRHVVCLSIWRRGLHFRRALVHLVDCHAIDGVLLRILKVHERLFLVSVYLAIWDNVGLRFVICRDLWFFRIIEVFLPFQLFWRAAEDVWESRLVGWLDALAWNTCRPRVFLLLFRFH